MMDPSYVFDVFPLERFAVKTSTAIKAPKEITCFSYDDEHKYRQDQSSLRYYYPPQIGADLSHGFDDFIKHDDSRDEHLDSLLKALIDLEQKTGERCSADLITWRGMMTKLLTAPFEQFDGFDMRATLFQGTIYIEEDHNAKVQRNLTQSKRAGSHNPQQEMFQYWGYKFESLCVLPDIWDATSRDYIEARPGHIVSNEAQYCSIVRTGMGPFSMLLAGEVDAVWDQKPEDEDASINYVELKTSQVPNGERDYIKLERKLCRMWAQSFLLGVPRIIIGFRTSNGILDSTVEYKTREIPGLVKRNHHTWDGNLAIKFLESVLAFLKESIKGDGVWRIHRGPKGRSIEVTKIEDGTGSILSEDFIEWRRDLQGREVAAMLGQAG